MYRKISDYFYKWKNSEYRKPLIVQGARQVGKTYSVLEFGRKNYENVAYFNFETNPELSDTFAGNISPVYLVPLLSYINKGTIVREKTLIIFDEIQLCERALTSLKYFYEEEPAYHIIALGSLLGVAVNREVYSFPVGKVDMKTMYPMDLEEFMIALGEENLTKQIRNCFNLKQAMPSVLHNAALELYRQYLVIGGMPECVDKFSRTKDYILIRTIQNNILDAYLNDMSKYNSPNEIQKTRQTYDSISVQLAKKNTRFQYKLIKTGGRAKEFENAIVWLNLAGLVQTIYNLDQIKKPLNNYRNIDHFKIYFSDLGILSAMNDINANDILYMDGSLDGFKGGLTENYVNIQLTINGYKTYYWQSDRSAEVDFVIQIDDKIIPIEVKSADNTKAKSLNLYMNTYKPNYAIKLSTKNFGSIDNKRIIPLYAAFCI